MKTADKQPGFEKSLERLESIVQEMESGALSLDKMMKDFEEGMALVKLCTDTLNEVEHKIEMLVKKSGPVTAEPFTAPDADAGPNKDADNSR